MQTFRSVFTATTKFTLGAMYLMTIQQSLIANGNHFIYFVVAVVSIKQASISFLHIELTLFHSLVSSGF
jgi:hypothetical protein